MNAVAVIMIDSEKLCRDSDRSSNISDVKLEVRNGASASNQNCDDCNTGQDSDSVITRLSLLNSSLGYDSRLDPDFLPKSVSNSALYLLSGKISVSFAIFFF